MKKHLVPKRFLQPRKTGFMEYIQKKRDEYEDWTGIAPGTIYLGNREMRELVCHLPKEERDKIVNWPPEDVYVMGMRVIQVKLRFHLEVSWRGNRQWQNDLKEKTEHIPWDTDESL